MWSDFVKFQNICSKNLITYLFPQIQVFRMSFIFPIVHNNMYGGPYSNYIFTFYPLY